MVEINIIGETISHYKILEKLAGGGMFQISPRAMFVPLFGIPLVGGILESGTSGWKFENPSKRSVGGGVE